MNQNISADRYSMHEADQSPRAAPFSGDRGGASPSEGNKAGGRGRKLAGLGAVLLLASSLGFWLGSSSSIDIKGSVLGFLQWMGQPQLQIYESAYGLGENASANVMADYLLFVDETDVGARDAYLAQMGIEVKGDTIFPNAVVIALPSNANQPADELRAQPFTWMLVKDRPFFFCH